MDTNAFWKHPRLAGAAGGLLLLAIFFGLMFGLSSWAVAVKDFTRLLPWIGAIVTGFSIQVYLYALLKKSVYEASLKRAATGSVAASGGISAASMAACCAHHLVDVLPFLGFSAAAVFLSKYQELFLLVGVLSNALGIVMMLRVLKRMGFARKNPVLRRLRASTLDTAFNIGVVASVATALAYAAIIV